MSRRNRLKAPKGTRRAKGLGVIVEEHLEYRMPGRQKVEDFFFDVANARGSALAFCTPRGDEYISRAAAMAPGKRFSKEDRALVDTMVQTMRSEHEKLKTTVYGKRVPICIIPYKSSPAAMSYRGGYEAMHKHERFHARMRRAEQRADIDPNIDALEYGNFREEFVKEFQKDFGDLAKGLIRVGTSRRYADNKFWVPEEILARVEEMFKACSLEDPEECKKSERLYRDHIRNYDLERPPELHVPIDAFEQLRDKIAAKYGSAIEYGEDLTERVAAKKLAPASFKRPARGAGVVREYNVWEDEYQAPGMTRPAPRPPPRTVTAKKRAVAESMPVDVAVDEEWEFTDDAGGEVALPQFMRKLRGLAL